MEQELEGGQATAMQQYLDLDNKVRAEAQLGFQQIRSIEQQLRTAPQGFLSRADGAEAQALRSTIFSASVTIVGSFSKIIGWLSAIPSHTSTSFRNDNFSASDRITGRAESPLSTSHTTYDSTPPHSPRRNTRVPAAAAAKATQPVALHNPASPVTSPCHTPHSGSGMSEDSQNPLSSPVHLDSDGDAAAGGAARARRPANEAATSADPEVVKRRSLSVKRKFMPKVTVKQRATGTDPGNDGPPDDGHTWRKYGQKDILGSTNPRSYYRCTHKVELGCPATKYVQRCDEEPSAFDVTYRGNHTCQSIHQQQLPWPFSCSPEQLAMVRAHHQLPHSDHMSSPAIVSFPNVGGSLVNSSAVQQTHAMANSDEILFGGGRPGFSQIPATMSGGGPSSPRFRLGSSSIELGIQQQDFPVKPEDSNPSQQEAYDLNRLSQLTRDSLFGPDSNLYNILLASSRPEQNVIPSTLVEEGLQCHGELKRVKLQQHLIEPARSTNTSDNSGLVVDKSSDAAQDVEIWGQDLDGFSVPSRYGSNSSITANSGQSSRGLRNNRLASAERAGIDSIRESDTSEQRSAPFHMGLMDIMDYDITPFTGTSTFFSC